MWVSPPLEPNMWKSTYIDRLKLSRIQIQDLLHWDSLLVYHYSKSLSYYDPKKFLIHGLKILASPKLSFFPFFGWTKAFHINSEQIYCLKMFKKNRKNKSINILESVYHRCPFNSNLILASTPRLISCTAESAEKLSNSCKYSDSTWKACKHHQNLRKYF